MKIFSKKVKRILAFLASFLFGLIVLIGILGKIDWKEFWEAFSSFPKLGFFLVLLLTLGWVAIGVLRLKLIFKSKGFRFSLVELGKIWLAGFSILYFFPTLLFGGAAFQTHILNKKFLVPWQKSISSILIDNVLEMTIALLVILFGICFFIIETGFILLKIGVIFIIFFLIFTFLLFFYFKSFKKESVLKIFVKKFIQKLSIKNKVLEFEKEVFQFFNLKSKSFWQGITLSILKTLANLGRYSVLIYFLGKGTNVLRAFSVLSFSFVANLIPVPTALGSQELFQCLVFNAFGWGSPSAVLLTMILRAVLIRVTPVSLSPARIAQFMGAAPRQRGSKEG